MKNLNEIDLIKMEIERQTSLIGFLIDDGAVATAYDVEKEVNDLQRRLEVLEAATSTTV